MQKNAIYTTFYDFCLCSVSAPAWNILLSSTSGPPPAGRYHAYGANLGSRTLTHGHPAALPSLSRATRAPDACYDECY